MPRSDSRREETSGASLDRSVYYETGTACRPAPPRRAPPCAGAGAASAWRENGASAGDLPVILIAERDQNVRALQQFFLERAGLCVEFVGDGEAALERARAARPALIV